jgi:hypothetical protein
VSLLRLHAAGLSHRQIARSLGLGRTTVREYLARAEVAELVWPVPEGRCETDLERLLFPGANPFPERGRPRPDWARVHREPPHPPRRALDARDGAADVRGGEEEDHVQDPVIAGYPRSWPGRDRRSWSFSRTRFPVPEPGTGKSGYQPGTDPVRCGPQT